jgi:hypothetical protein
MRAKRGYLIAVIVLAISLTSCATSDPADEFVFDYASAETGDFNGFWRGRVDCGDVLGFEPFTMVKVASARGELGFGGGGVFTLGSLYADLDVQNGKIKWSGRLKPWATSRKEMSIAFKGQWMGKQFRLKGRIGSYNCSGVLAIQ